MHPHNQKLFLKDVTDAADVHLDVWLPMFIHSFELQQCKSSFSSHLQVFWKLQPDSNRRLICVHADEHQEDAEHFFVNG